MKSICEQNQQMKYTETKQVLCMRCPLCLENFSQKSQRVFPWVLIRKKLKEQTVTGTATLRHTVKMHHGVPQYRPLSTCQNH